MKGNLEDSLEWYKILQGCVPNDFGTLAHLGSIYRSQGDETQAFHNYLDVCFFFFILFCFIEIYCTLHPDVLLYFYF